MAKKNAQQDSYPIYEGEEALRRHFLVLKESKDQSEIQTALAAIEADTSIRKLTNYHLFRFGLAQKHGEDIRQLLRLAIVDAASRYDPDRKAIALLSIIIRNVVTNRFCHFSALRKATTERVCHIYDPKLSGCDVEFANIIPSRNMSQSASVEDRETAARILPKLKKLLTPLEYKCYIAICANGWTYAEVEEKFSLKHKAVDNAIGRARNKIEKNMKEFKKLADY